MKLVDTHCHLTFEPMFDRLRPVLERARKANVDRVIVPSYDLDSWKHVEHVAGFEGVSCAYGLHPWVADQPLSRTDLERALDREKVVAIGEIGLDYKIPKYDRRRQMEVLRIQLDVAVERSLPVILHCRGAFDDLLDVLASYNGDVTGVLHAFSRGPQLALRFTDLGLYLGFGGAITRPGAIRCHKSAGVVPLDRIVLETDAPSIGLDGVEPTDVEPRHVLDIAESLASARDTDMVDIAQTTTRNAEKIFGL